MDESEIFGKIFQIGEFAKTYMPDGRMNGIRSGCVYQWAYRTVFDIVQQLLPVAENIFRHSRDAVYKNAVYRRQISLGKRKTNLDIQLFLQRFGK